MRFKEGEFVILKYNFKKRNSIKIEKRTNQEVETNSSDCKFSRFI